MTPLRLLLFTLALLVQSFVAERALAQVSVQTTVSAEKLEVGQELRVRAQATSPSGSLESPRLRVPPSFIVNGPSVATQQQITIVNGRMERSVGTTATWVLTPTKTGVFQVGPSSFEEGGRTVTGNAIRVEVVPEGTLPVQRRRGLPFPFDDDPFSPFGRGGSLFDDLLPRREERLMPPAPPDYQVTHAPDPNAFLRATLEPKQAVVGQQVTLRVYAYGALGPFADGQAKEPRHPDFFAQPLMASGSKQRHYAVDIGDRRYLALKVREIALFPLKAGKLEIGPMTMSFYGRGYATRTQPEGLERSSEPIVVEVTEPPLAGRPPGYQLGDVGDFELKAQTSPQQVDAGGAVSVTVSVEGRGRLPGSLITPEQKGLEWLEPSLTDQPRVSEDGTLGGTRTFTYLVRLNQPGTIDLGAITFPHFSPSRGGYHVASARVGTVEVRAAPEAPLAEAPRQKLAEQFSVRSEPRGAVRSDHLADHRWYTPVLLLPPALVLFWRGALSAVRQSRKKQSARAKDPRELSREALRLAARELSRGTTTEGLAALERSLLLAMEAATSVRGRAVLLRDLEGVLTARGLDRALAATAVELLSRCQEARFGRAAVNGRELLAEVKACSKRLERHRPASSGARA